MKVTITKGDITLVVDDSKYFGNARIKSTGHHKAIESVLEMMVYSVEYLYKNTGGDEATPTIEPSETLVEMD